MPVKIISRTSTPALNSGTSDSLIGNVGDWLTTVIDTEVSVKLDTQDGYTVTLGNTGICTLLGGGNWVDFGFEVGDTISVSINYTDATNTASSSTTATNAAITITSINGNAMQMDTTVTPSVSTSANVPGQDAVWVYNWITFTADKDFTGIEFKYNQLLNSDINTGTLNSILDATNTAFKGGGLDATDTVTWVAIQAITPQSGNSVYSCEVRGSGKSSGVSSFDIRIVHNISGVYDAASDITNSDAPDWYDGSDCVTDVYTAKFYKTFGDENLTLTSEVDDPIVKKLGNTGWFNESKNGQPSNYTLSNVTYENSSADPVTGVLLAEPTTIKFTVTDVNSAFTASSQFNFGIAFAPLNRAAIGNNALINLGNLTANTLGVAQSYIGTVSPVVSTINGFANLDGAYIQITSYHFEVISASQLDVEIITDNIDVNIYLDTLSSVDRQALWWVSVGDENSILTTDRVNLMQPALFIDAAVETEEYTFKSINYFPYALDYYAGDTPYKYDFDGRPLVVEDDAHINFDFSMKDNNIIKSVTFGIDIADSSGNLLYVADSYSVNLINQPIDNNGTQQINYIGARQFLYDADFKDNKISLVRNVAGDAGTTRNYMFTTPYRMRWEWWKVDPLLPQAFYVLADPNNNLNYEWFRKQIGTANFRHFIELEIEAADGTITNYRNAYDMALINYDNDVTYTKLIEVFPDDTFATASTLGAKTNQYTGVEYGIIEGQDNFIKATISKAAFSFANYKYCEITIEVNDGAGWLSMWKIRTDQTPSADNPLQPLSGEIVLKATVGTNELYTQCKLDPSLLPDDIEYKITAEWVCYREGAEEFTEYFERTIDFGKFIKLAEPTPTEDRSSGICDYTIPVLASTTDDSLYKNDILGLLYKKADSSFNIDLFLVDEAGTEYALNDNTYGTFFDFGDFTYEPDVIAYQVAWRLVLNVIGAGCYSFKRVVTEFGVDTTFYSCCYDVQEFTTDLAEGTVRVETVMNGYLKDLDINYKGINWGSHLRFEGFFGNRQPKYDQTVIINTNEEQNLNQQDLTSEYFLSSKIVPHKCITAPLYDYYLRGSELYISDYNRHNHSYDYKSFPVFLGDVENVKYLERNRGAVVSVRFTEKQLSRRYSTADGNRPLNYVIPSYVFPSGIAVRETFLKAIFESGDNEMLILTIDADNAGTYTAITDDGSSGTITVDINGGGYAAFVNPTVLAVSDTIKFKRTVTTALGFAKISGTY